MKTSYPKTVEFEMGYFIPESWYEIARRVWNQGLFYLNWLQHYKRVSLWQSFDLPPVEIKVRKQTKTLEGMIAEVLGKGKSKSTSKSVKSEKTEYWAYYCDIAYETRIDKTKSWEKENITLVYHWMTAAEWFASPPENPEEFYKERRKGSNLVNPIWLTEPPVTEYSAISLRKPFAKKRCEWIAESTIPAVLVNDFIANNLMAAWETYQKGIRGKPRYKPQGDHTKRVNTLQCDSFRGQCSIEGDTIKLPGLKKTTIAGLQQRLFQPIAGMVKDMQANPDNYPRLNGKIKKIVGLQRNKLIKADGHDIKQLRKDLSEDDLQAFYEAYEAKLDHDSIYEKAIDYFSSPGSFRLIRRQGSQYLQISAEMPVSYTPSTKTVAVDTGTAMLIDATNGLQVKHQDFSEDLDRIRKLQQKLANKTPGSNNYRKLSDKIAAIKGRIKRSKRGYQHYWAQQIADVNGTILIKQISVPDSIEVPIPVPNKKGDKYLPNRRGEARDQNRELMDAAIGQFINLIETTAAPMERTVTRVEVEPETPPVAILNPDVTPPNVVSITAAPEKRPRVRRNRKREQKIG